MSCRGDPRGRQAASEAIAAHAPGRFGTSCMTSRPTWFLEVQGLRGPACTPREAVSWRYGAHNRFARGPMTSRVIATGGDRIALVMRCCAKIWGEPDTYVLLVCFVDQGLVFGMVLDIFGDKWT